MDRFYRGLVAGVAGGVLMNIWSLFSYHILNFTERRFLDWASVLLFGELPRNLLQTAVSLFTQLMWSGLLGIIFAYLIPNITSRGYLIKGAFWGFITGFLQFAFAVLLRMPYFYRLTTDTVVSQIIGGLMWGFAMAYFLRRLDSTRLKRA